MRMRIVLATALIISLTLCLQTFFSQDGWRARQARAAELETIRVENDAKAARAAFLHGQIQALRKRSDVQEHVIRDELGYVRPGDVVIDLAKRN